MNIDSSYYESYKIEVGALIPEWVSKFDFSESHIDFSHRIIASAVFSSNIEGNSVDLNSYLNWRNLTRTKPDKNIKEINNLIEAYEFAGAEKLTEKNLLQAHKILSQQFLIKSKQGKYRTEPIGVFGESGLIYVAGEPQLVKGYMQAFFEEIGQLLARDLSVAEAFYYAAFIHLRFVHIHPFSDGNGRVARLLEKWFLAEKAGPQFWKVPTEKYYKEHLINYYKNIALGPNFYEVNYDRCLPFLTMLPKALHF